VAKLTTHEVLKRCEIESSKTLTRWYRKKLIPLPSIGTHPNGRGKIAYWPGWVVFRIHEVKARLALGESLDQIARSLSQDWSAEEKRWIRKRPDFAADYARVNRDLGTLKFAELAADIVYGHLQRIGVKRPGAVYGRLWDEFSNCKLVDELLQLLQDGYTPVVVIIGKSMRVIPDFLLATATAHPKWPNEPFIVVPIRDTFLEAFAEAYPDLTKGPRITAVHRVVKRGNKRSAERSYRHLSRWEFELE
jgi:hypothetical protein